MAIICEKFPKFWVRWEKYIELDLKFAWVRSKIRSELGPQKRKNNPALVTGVNTAFVSDFERGSSAESSGKLRVQVKFGFQEITQIFLANSKIGWYWACSTHITFSPPMTHL